MPQQTIPLTTFTLCDAEPGSGVDDIRRRPETDWLPATVPGGVHEALLAAGRIAEPYFDRNEDGVRWVEERDWWFRTTVPATSSSPGGRTLLVCQGLDTVADLWLGGQPLGHSENMFRPATFDITGRLEAAAELLICFRPPLAGLTPPAAATNLLQRLGDALGALAPEEPAGDEGAGMMVLDVAAGHPTAQGDVLVGLGLRSAIAVDRTVATGRSGAAIGCCAERTPCTHRAGRRGPPDC